MPRPQTAGAGTASVATGTAWRSIGGRSVPSCPAAVKQRPIGKSDVNLERNSDRIGQAPNRALRPRDPIRYPARTDAPLERNREIRPGVCRPVRGPGQPLRGAAQSLAGVSLLPPRRSSSYHRRESTFSESLSSPRRGARTEPKGGERSERPAATPARPFPRARCVWHRAGRGRPRSRVSRAARPCSCGSCSSRASRRLGG